MFERTNIYLDEEQARLRRHLSIEQGRSFTDIVREALIVPISTLGYTLLERAARCRRQVRRGVRTMKALEFQAQMNPDSTLTVPAELAAQVHPQQPVRVILLVPESTEDQDWARLTSEQFLKGYAESDSVYDDLSAG